MRLGVCGYVSVVLMALAGCPDPLLADQPDERPSLVHVSATAVVEPAGRMTVDGRQTVDPDRSPLGFALRLDLRAMDWLRLGAGLLFVSTPVSDVRLPVFEMFASVRLGFSIDSEHVRSFTFARVEVGYATMFRTFDSEGTPGLVLGTSVGTEFRVGPRFGLIVEAGLRYRRHQVYRELLLPNELFQRVGFVLFVGPAVSF